MTAMLADATAQLNAVKEQLSALGYTSDNIEDCLHAGPERARVITHLMQKLLPMQLEQLMSRMDTDDFRQLQQMAHSERQAHKYSTLLASMGVTATVEQIQGTAAYPASFSFLQSFINTVSSVHSMRTASSTGPVTSSLEQPQQQLQQHLQDITNKPQAASKLLEYVCEQIPSLVSENITLLPTDITKASQPYSEQARQLLDNREQAANILNEGIARLKEKAEQLSSQVTADKDWQGSQQACASAFQDFMAALQRFTDVYHQELGVWCATSEAPQTRGFGQQAAVMLDAQTRLAGLLNDLKSVRDMHAAITQSHSPLKAYAPQEMIQLANHSQQEAASIAQQLAILSRS